MRRLLWKDFRLARPLLILAVILCVVPIAAAATLLPISPHRPELRWREGITFAVLLMQLPLVIWGGVALGGERADRSAEFQNYLPIPRRRILVSKLLITLTLLALIWIPNLILAFLGSTAEHRTNDFIHTLILTTFATAFGLLGFSVAWCCSTFLRSPTYAACLGILSPFLFTLMEMPLAKVLNINITPFDERIGFVILAATPPAYVIFFLAGTLRYLRRVEA